MHMVDAERKGLARTQNFLQHYNWDNTLHYVQPIVHFKTYTTDGRSTELLGWSIDIVNNLFCFFFFGSVNGYCEQP